MKIVSFFVQNCLFNLQKKIEASYTKKGYGNFMEKSLKWDHIKVYRESYTVKNVFLQKPVKSVVYR